VRTLLLFAALLRTSTTTILRLSIKRSIGLLTNRTLLLHKQISPPIMRFLQIKILLKARRLLLLLDTSSPYKKAKGAAEWLSKVEERTQIVKID